MAETTDTIQMAPGETATRPWQRGVAWLLFLGPFFFLSYGGANWWAANHATPGAIVFDWEKYIPFWSWTIIPYWSIDLLYGLAFLLCKDRHEIDTLALRLLTVQLVSISCFIAFPLTFTFDRPDSNGLFGAMFNALSGFDQPYNQAPSLHIGLLVVLWLRYARSSRGPALWLTHLWAALIGISVLTTYQHHFLDVPSGAIVGFIAAWLWPEHQQSLLCQWRLSDDRKRRQLAQRYLLGTTLCGLTAFFGGWALWMLWPGLSLLIVSLIYLGLGSAGFQKHAGGHSVAATILLAPYLAGAWINSRLWTWRDPAPSRISDDVWISRLPGCAQMKSGHFTAIFDLTAELTAPNGNWRRNSLPMLDLVAPDPQALASAAEQIEHLRRHGKTLVCCALGRSRSASAVAAWLLYTQRAANVDEAVAIVTRQRPQVILEPAHRQALEILAAGVCRDKTASHHG
jgi:membrane-associated phospholipid phosphatase